MVDARLLVNEQDFQTYLAFSKQLDAEKLTAEGGSITMYTVSAVRCAPAVAAAPTAVAFAFTTVAAAADTRLSLSVTK
jgi:hypothetical protein